MTPQVHYRVVFQGGALSIPFRKRSHAWHHADGMRGIAKRGPAWPVGVVRITLKRPCDDP